MGVGASREQNWGKYATHPPKKANPITALANSFLNALSDDNITRIWLPLVVYENTDQKDTTRLGALWEWSTHVTVSREGNSGVAVSL